MSKKEEKLNQLTKNWGYETSESLVADYAFASIVPGICMNENCDYTTDVEPDCRKGHCELCGTKSVESCLSLEGIA